MNRGAFEPRHRLTARIGHCQGLKPSFFPHGTARLKSCPDTEPILLTRAPGWPAKTSAHFTNSPRDPAHACAEMDSGADAAPSLKPALPRGRWPGKDGLRYSINRAS